MPRPRSIKEVEYEILKYVMFARLGTFDGLTDLFISLGATVNEERRMVRVKNAKDKPLQKRIFTARKNMANVFGNMLDKRIKYLTEEHIDYNINSYKECDGYRKEVIKWKEK